MLNNRQLSDQLNELFRKYLNAEEKDNIKVQEIVLGSDDKGAAVLVISRLLGCSITDVNRVKNDLKTLASNAPNNELNEMTVSSKVANDGMKELINQVLDFKPANDAERKDKKIVLKTIREACVQSNNDIYPSVVKEHQQMAKLAELKTLCKKEFNRLRSQIHTATNTNGGQIEYEQHPNFPRIQKIKEMQALLTPDKVDLTTIGKNMKTLLADYAPKSSTRHPAIEKFIEKASSILPEFLKTNEMKNKSFARKGHSFFTPQKAGSTDLEVISPTFIVKPVKPSR